MTFRTYSIIVFQYVNTVFNLIIVFYNFKNIPYAEDYLTFGTLKEFNQRWYLIIGSPLLLTIVIQIFSPHVRLLMIFVYKGFHRCFDRGFSLN